MTARTGLAAVAIVGTLACGDGGGPSTSQREVEGARMNALAERYVRLVLALGQHDADYVDAYYGPPEWKPTGDKRPLADLDRDAVALEMELGRAVPGPDREELVQLRHRYLVRQLASLRTRIAMLSGTRLSFDQESDALYDAVAPIRTEADFAETVRALEARLPGSGPLVDRYNRFRDRFTIPKDRLDATFRAAIAGCKARTAAHVSLPATESFTVEYVTGKSWSGYNWYQGGYRSLIQVNTDLPILVDRAIDLACHEGYPGHHVYNVLLEQHLVRERGWVEYSVYPLFSPQSLIAEGTANYGIEVTFPLPERLEFERRVIFPSAGLDPAGVEDYYAVMALVDRLSYAGNEAARQYLDGKIDAKSAADLLVAWGLYSRPRAEQRVRFVDQYRSYVINYNLGKDLVAAHVTALAGGDDASRWRAFEGLLSSPRLPSGLAPRR
ncbi:MAG TPA: hypothetical protein VIY56_02605 [Vicinamibacterales bacterium]